MVIPIFFRTFATTIKTITIKIRLIMEHKLFKATIKTYYFGVKRYYLYVLADDSDEALKFIYNSPSYGGDEDAEVEEIIEISAEEKGIV